jgi:hypothetical protein
MSPAVALSAQYVATRPRRRADDLVKTGCAQ